MSPQPDAISLATPHDSADVAGGCPGCAPAVFDFQLHYSENWREGFNESLEKMMADVEAAKLPEEVLNCACLSVKIASGPKIEITVSELETEGIPMNDLFPECEMDVEIHFPLDVKFGPPEPVERDSRPVTPTLLRDEFARNLLHKAPRFGDSARHEELLQIFMADCDLLSVIVEKAN